MNKKKRIGLLTIVIFIAGLIMTVIDAVVTVTYGVIPTGPSTNFFELVIEGPLWWEVNPVIIITIIGVGVTAFVLEMTQDPLKTCSHSCPLSSRS